MYLGSIKSVLSTSNIYMVEMQTEAALGEHFKNYSIMVCAS